MNLLATLFPQVRAQVLRLLFADPAAEFHLRDLTRRSGLALGTIQTELAKLAAAQLIASERDGNRRYYRANAAHPLFPTLRQLVLQTTANPPTLAAPASNATPTKPAANPPTGATAVSSVTRLPLSSDRPQSSVVDPPPLDHTLTLNELD